MRSMPLEQRLGQIALLNNLTPDELRQVCRVSAQKKYLANDIIIKDGDTAHAFYFILQGSVKIFKRTKAGKIISLATLEEDNCFGEQAYENFSIRTSSAKAISDVLLLEISYEILNHIFRDSLKSKILLEKQTLGKSVNNLQKQLACIDSYVKRDLFTNSDKTTLVHFKKDDIIFTLGDNSDAAYFISSGSVLLDFAPNEPNTRTLLINENHLFGELGVLQHQPRRATAKAYTTVSALKINRDEFLMACRQSIGLKKLILALEKIYFLPHHHLITEQYIGQLDNEDAILMKYALSNQRYAICAISIEHPIYLLNVRDTASTQSYTFTNTAAHELEIHLENNHVVGIKAIGTWPKLQDLCELLLKQTPIQHTDEQAFSIYASMPPP